MSDTLVNEECGGPLSDTAMNDPASPFDSIHSSHDIHVKKLVLN